MAEGKGFPMAGECPSLTPWLCIVFVQFFRDASGPQNGSCAKTSLKGLSFKGNLSSLLQSPHTQDKSLDSLFNHIDQAPSSPPDPNLIPPTPKSPKPQEEQSSGCSAAAFGPVSLIPMVLPLFGCSVCAHLGNELPCTGAGRVI